MGSYISIITQLYDSEGQFVEEYESNEPCKELFYLFHEPDLVHCKLSDSLSPDKLKPLKVGYASDSFSVSDGYATYVEKIQSPQDAYEQWRVIKLIVGRSLRAYKKEATIQPNIMEQYYWLSFTIGSLISYVNYAKRHHYQLQFVFREG